MHTLSLRITLQASLFAFASSTLVAGCDEPVDGMDDEFMGQDGGKADGASRGFSDVPSNHPFYDEIEALRAEGFVSGFTCTQADAQGLGLPLDELPTGAICFRPEAPMKRAEAIAVLHGALVDASAKGTYCNRAPAISDMRGHWAETAVADAMCAGWIPEQATFRPDEPVTLAGLYITLARANHLGAPSPADDASGWNPAALDDATVERALSCDGSLGCIHDGLDLSDEDERYLAMAFERGLVPEEVRIKRSVAPAASRGEAAFAFAFAILFDAVTE